MTVSQDIINLFDRFTHGGMDRRTFMQRLTAMAGGSAAAMALLSVLENNYARAEMVAADDSRLKAEDASYPGPDGAINGYLVRPVESGKRGTVIVIHENRGLNPHIRDVARRIALEGYNAFAVDLLSRDGGTPEDSDKARDMIGKLDPELNAQRLAAAVPFFAAHPEGNGKVGAVGFCWGGGMVNQLAVRSPDLAAGVAYYGRQVDAARVPEIKAPLLLHYAGNDENINPGIADYEAALKANGK
ncbi:MAG TPA: dienelactone hydrolase family protein, partial [Verrucomicrobiae bacterium]|nr:dienelactone hydrolase family protein [Verrucomicrobiae bacterium]